MTELERLRKELRDFNKCFQLQRDYLHDLQVRIDALAAPQPPTIESVYGATFEELVAQLETPGYVFRLPGGAPEFRPPVKDDIVLSPGRNVFQVATDGTSEPRLIMRKARRWVFEETGEVRAAKSGEYWLNDNGDIYPWDRDFPTWYAYPILRIVEQP